MENHGGQLKLELGGHFRRYLHQGLNKITKESASSSALIEYDADNPTEFKFDPLFYSGPQAQGEAYVAKPKIRGFGMKIQYAFQF